MISLNTPIEMAPKINRRIVPALKRLGIHTVRDILFHLPARYEDFSNEKKIRDIEAGEIVTIRGTIKKIANRRTARKRMILTEALVEDETGILKAIWFNQPFLLRMLKPGSFVNLSGRVSRGPHGIYLQNPAHERIQNSKFPPMARLASGGKIPNSQEIHTGGLVAIYPESYGITSRWIRFLVKSFFPLASSLRDPLPEETRTKYQMPQIKDALTSIHFPAKEIDASRARKRFAFQDLLLIQLRSMRERLSLKKEKAPAIPLQIQLIKEFVQSLPFELTNAQRRSLWEILQDIAKSSPMNRILEGDVGSGKTVVAAGAALAIIKTGWRVACMAPTEILARQHFDTFNRLLTPFGIRIGLAVGAEKKLAGNPDMIIGTHALIQKNMRFEKLGLVIIDEQHRFGVSQRAALLKNQESRVKNQEKEPLILNSQFLIPHFLSMSATPIPRTLALTIYGDLDLSILDEMPKGRKEIKTRVVEPEQREETYRFIRTEIEKGRQIFVICPRIDQSKKEADEETKERTPVSERQLILWDVKTVTDEHKRLSEKIFPNFRIAILHGKMKSKEKNAVMKKFKNREYDILVSTSVIEVGVDIPNATVMMIEGAERFGLAQLHQFRGRVGRGAEQSYCLLMPTEGGTTSRRLRAITEARNGFELAQKDLEIRGAGDLLGTQQSGISPETIAVLNDAKLVRDVRREAAELIQKSPDLSQYPELLFALSAAEKKIHFE